MDYYFTENEYEYDDGMVIALELRVHNNWQSFLKKSPCLVFEKDKWAGDWSYIATGYNIVLAELSQGVMMTIYVYNKKGKLKEFVKTIRDSRNCSGEIVDKIFEKRMIQILTNFRSKELLMRVLR